jgi:hypothetical protein
VRLAPAILLFSSAIACGAPSRTQPSSSPPNATTTASNASSTPPCADDAFGAPASFALDRNELRAKGASAKLLEKLGRSPYAYFRSLARPYELRTCAAFRAERWHLPVIAIHADPHLEQFTVTSTTAGLEDFDQSGYGPAVVDLVRYGASIHLACREVKWQCSAERIVASYFQAYREALSRPPVRKELAVTGRLRKKTPGAAEPWLRWAEGLMQPLSEEQEARVRKGWLGFRRLESEVHPERPQAFYDIVRIGALQMGVGSALETKLLLRLRGATDAPTDDVIVEARTTIPPSGKECAMRPLHGGAIQPLMFMALLGPRMPEVYGFATLADDPSPEFWVQSWLAGYRELTIADIENEQELVELVEDAGRQLAGHFWTKFPEALRDVQRHAQLKAFDVTVERARTLAGELAQETVKEWDRFRASP